MAVPLPRYLTERIRADLARKMVFVSGPRQVGKTTLVRHLLAEPAGYLNWDIPEHRDAILRGRLPRMHPLSVAELDIDDPAGLMRLLDRGGFPEPYLSESMDAAQRWSREYRARLIEDEIGDLERVDDLSTLQLLAVRLSDLVGSPLSVNALREDLGVSHRTVSRWLEIFERLYAIVRIAPFDAPAIRAIRKARKHYHYDWLPVADRAARFENFVALHLLKWIHHEQDVRGRELDLRYFRDVDGREVDFVVTERRAPTHLIEVKWSDRPPDRGLRYLSERFPGASAYQLSATGGDDYRTPDGIRVQPALPFLRGLV